MDIPPSVLDGINKTRQSEIDAITEKYSRPTNADEYKEFFTLMIHEKYNIYKRWVQELIYINADLAEKISSTKDIEEKADSGVVDMENGRETTDINQNDFQASLLSSTKFEGSDSWACGAEIMFSADISEESMKSLLKMFQMQYKESTILQEKTEKVLEENKKLQHKYDELLLEMTAMEKEKILLSLKVGKLERLVAKNKRSKAWLF